MDISFGRVDPLSALEDLPERVQREIDDDTDVSGQEVFDGERRERVEAVEEGDQNEGDQ